MLPTNSGSRLSQISSDASSWDMRYASQELVWSLEPNVFVSTQLKELPAGKMIDHAGGEGRNALWFASRGWQVENVEISKVALEKFQLRAEREGIADRCISNLATAETAKFNLAPDLVVIAYLQLPFHQLEMALDNAVSQSEPGTRFFGVWHALRNLTDGVGGPPMPEVLPTPEQLESWAQDKLTNFAVYEAEREVQVDGETRVAIDVILSGEL